MCLLFYAYNMLNTYIYHHLPPTGFCVCYTIIGETIALLAQEMYAVKCYVYVYFTFYSTLYVTTLQKACSS